MYPKAAIHHLAYTDFDHCPILLKCETSPMIRLARPFSFQPMWMSYLLFSKVVSDAWVDDMVLRMNIEKFTEDVRIWNKDMFGNLFHRKNRVEARRREYFDILQQEEEFWSIKSRYK